MLDIKETQQEIDRLFSEDDQNDQVETANDQIEVSNGGYIITDEEIDHWAKFSDYEKKIIKEAYARHPKGFFPNPWCALR